jgi:hypothetical protein
MPFSRDLLRPDTLCVFNHPDTAAQGRILGIVCRQRSQVFIRQRHQARTVAIGRICGCHTENQ